MLLGILCLVALPAQAQINQLDEQGRKQGKWIQKYKNGITRFKGQFKDGNPIGDFTYYDYKANKTAQVSFQADGTAQATLFHPNGNKAGEGDYAREQKQGVWLFYDVKGVLSAEETFVNGKRHGPSQTFYLNGQVARETAFHEGVENGLRKDYFEDGTPRFTGQIVEANFQGEVTFYHETGHPKLKGSYQNGVKEGKWIVYDENGIPKKILKYTSGRLEEKTGEQSPTADDQ